MYPRIPTIATSKYVSSEYVKQQALACGFSAVGICDAAPLIESGRLLDAWLDRGLQGTMNWLARTRHERRSPTAYFPEARSIIVVALNYYQEHEPHEADVHYARYAIGRDYHKVIKQKLKVLVSKLQAVAPGAIHRPCVDSFPLMEKPLAVKAGLGWIGKNTNLIIKGRGSYFFLGELLTSLELTPDEPFANEHCGNCNRCSQACPTDALATPFSLDARKCIAYLTIERKGEMPPQLAELLSEWVFGCDICQEVCPWNKFSTNTSEPDFRSRLQQEQYLLSYLLTLDEKAFEHIFAGTPIKRAGYRKFMESVAAVKAHQERLSILS